MEFNQILSCNPDVQHGQVVFSGTRVPISTLFDHLESGVSLAEFLEDFPTVSREQAVALLEFAKDSITKLLSGVSSEVVA